MLLSPLILVLAGAAFGAAILVFVFQRAGGRTLLGGGLGAVAGGLGSMLFMVPLDYCTFEAERSSLDVAFGVVLVAVGVALVVSPVAWIARRLLRHEPLVSSDSQPTQGTFRHGWIAF